MKAKVQEKSPAPPLYVYYYYKHLFSGVPRSPGACPDRAILVFLGTGALSSWEGGDSPASVGLHSHAVGIGTWTGRQDVCDTMEEAAV